LLHTSIQQLTDLNSIILYAFSSLLGIAIFFIIKKYIQIIWYELYIFYKKLKKGKTPKHIAEGFGLLCNGSIVMDNKMPLIFGTQQEALAYTKVRGLGKPNSLNTEGVKVDLIWQTWNAKTLEVTVGHVISKDDYKRNKDLFK